MQALFQIAYQTSRECLREPVFVVLQLVSLFIIGIHPVLALFAFREQQKLVTDGSLATILLFGWVTGVLCANNAIRREIDNGTVLLVLSKPVKRSIFIVSKVIGISTVLILTVWINGIATLLAVRIAKHQFDLEKNIFLLYLGGMCLACIIGGMYNFFSRASFSSSTSIALVVIFTSIAILVFWLPEYNGGYLQGRHIEYPENLIKAITLLVPAVLIMGTIATTFSVYLNQFTNNILCAAFFFLGLISDYLYDQIIRLSYADIIRLLHFWPCFLIPPLILLWILAPRMIYRCPRSSLKQNLIYVALIGLLACLAVYSKVNHAEFRPANSFIKLTATIIYNTKNSVSEILYTIIPNWQLFWMADALVTQRTIPFTYLVFGFAYTICFMFVFTCFAFLLFSIREIGQQLPR